jgi:hypothetical protein
MRGEDCRTLPAASAPAFSTRLMHCWRCQKPGPPKHTGNPRMTGLRSWHVKGFDEFRVYYLAHRELITVVRILHSKQDTGSILTRQELEEP